MYAIGFSTGKHSPISAAIRYMTHSKVSHAYLIYDDEDLGDRYILEADIGGFQPDRYSIFKRKNTVVAEVPITLYPGTLQAADKMVGVVGYDYSGLVGEFFVKLARWGGKKISNPIHNPHSMFCSEAMVHVLQQGKVPGADQLVPQNTDPQALLDFLIVHGYKAQFDPLPES